MSFETEFPNFKGKMVDDEGLAWDVENELSDFHKKMLQEYCLDKKKVLDAFKKHCVIAEDINTGTMRLDVKNPREFLKELKIG